MTTQLSRPSQSPPFKTMKPGQIQASRGITIYGRSGVGKTSLLATMPGKGLVIDVPQSEGGTEVLEDHADHLDVAIVTKWEEIDPIYTYLESGNHDYKWVAIDSITAFQKLARRKVVRERPISADPHKVTLEEYGKINSLVEEMIYRFRTLSIFTVWIAQEKKHSSEGDSRSVWGPDLQPGCVAALLPSMLLVGRMVTEITLNGEEERRMIISNRPDTMAKYRAKPSVEVPHIIKNPHLTVLLLTLAGRSNELEALHLPHVQGVSDSFSLFGDDEVS